jgi:hypothetical protein
VNAAHFQKLLPRTAESFRQRARRSPHEFEAKLGVGLAEFQLNNRWYL